MADRPLVICAIAYGDEYGALFSGPCLTSLLDPSNLPAVKDRVTFELYTDQRTLDGLQQTENFHRLKALLPVTVFRLQAPHYDFRYSTEAQVLAASMGRASELGADFMYVNADLCYGVGTVPKMVQAMDDGHDAVAAQALRSTAEVIAQPLHDAQRALSASELFRLAFPALHPLWMASHWNAAHFTHSPYTLCWSDASQLITRSTSVSCYMVRPTASMLQGSPDMTMWRSVNNPLVITEWSDLPLVVCERILGFYPPHRMQGPASVGTYLQWAFQAGLRDQLANLNNLWHYQDPDHPATQLNRTILENESSSVVWLIQERAASYPAAA